MQRRASNYPAQEGSYAVKVKNGAGWHGFDTARLQISVGQPYHEGEKLEATVDWLRHRFDRAIVCVNDTLQRHNLMFEGVSERAALMQCIAQGQAWIARNRRSLERLPNVEIHCFDQWRGMPRFQDTHDRVRRLYATDARFRAAVDGEIGARWKRKVGDQGLSEAFRFQVFKVHAVNYLIEETAAFFLMFEKDRAVDIYPGSTLLPNALAETYGNGAQAHFTRIDFRRRDARRLEAA